MDIRLLAVSVGKPAVLGIWQDEEVISGIKKSPLTVASVAVSETNIAGDGQADLTVHGGPDKAVYIYAADHWPWWEADAKFMGAPASFGENLTIEGADEHTVRIGDRFQWGEVELEVSQPRAPCYKFTMLTARHDMAARMTASARTGWYTRVLQTGEAPTRGTITRTHTDEAMPTVRDAFVAVYHPRVRSDVIERVLTAPALSRDWRHGILRRLRSAGVI
jgi:MOSC domain-containing protein YiiM